LKNIESHDKGYFYPWGKLPRGKKEYDWTGLSLLFGARSNKTLSVGKKGG
jgi:hypothetical protein